MQRTLLFKCLLLAMLVVLLIIPLSMIEHTIAERSSYRDQAVNAIAASSAGRQVLAGPVLTIPVEEEYEEEVVPGKNGASAYGVVRRKRTLMVTSLPKNLERKGGLKAERRAYGIHSAAVFDMHMALSGSFDLPTAADVPNRGRNSLLTWGTPRLVVGISDVRGLVGVRGTQPTSLNSGFHADLPAAGMSTHATGPIRASAAASCHASGRWASRAFRRIGPSARLPPTCSATHRCK